MGISSCNCMCIRVYSRLKAALGILSRKKYSPRNQVFTKLFERLEKQALGWTIRNDSQNDCGSDLLFLLKAPEMMSKNGSLLT